MSRKRTIDVDGILFLWMKVKELINSKIEDKADKTELSNYAKAADVYNRSEVYTKQEVDSKTSSAMRYKGTVLNYGDLPTTAEIGDTYNITNESDNNKAGDNAVWAGDHWDILSGVIDMTNVLTTEDIATAEELEALLV